MQHQFLEAGVAPELMRILEDKTEPENTIEAAAGAVANLGCVPAARESLLAVGAVKVLVTQMTDALERARVRSAESSTATKLCDDVAQVLSCLSMLIGCWLGG